MADEMEEILDLLEADIPGPGIKRAKSYIKEGASGDETSQLAYGIATGYFRLEDYERTLEWLERTDDSRRFLFKGFCFLELQRFEEAEKIFQKVAREEPARREQCDILRAQALFLNGDFERAEKLYNELLEQELADRHHSEVLFSLALLNLTRDEYKKAFPYLNDLIDGYEGTPLYLEGLYYLAVTLEKLGKIEQAIEEAKKLKKEGEETMWSSVAGDLLSRFHSLKKKRRSGLQQYEY